ncbi:unnamed protein product [Brassicogethes aeneus]|uniref:Serine palmitoyltransferase 1 n=1 Tax=Brassicogethes aeneus TaxID=1431903 RepID=A0A9P0FAU6_BRAAE|nr:unnamed protein product [Brassicogethes aeneus]
MFLALIMPGKLLNQQILQERLRNFNPEPLVEYESDEIKENIETSIVNEDKNNIDLAKANYLNMLNNNDIKQASENIIRKYGVGTCGPRAFYGTTDVHLELEEHIAKFLGLEEAIVYSYGFVAIASSIAAYCKKSDVVFIANDSNAAILQGLVSARSRVIRFNHQDPESLKIEARKVMEGEKGGKKCRKFLVLEGVSWKSGKVCDLPLFLDIAEEFKMRVFLEESYSIGIFGKNGKGLLEHFNIEKNRVDMIMGTLENAIGSIGGFCAGTQNTIEHQRLSGSGYIFSASLPTFLVQAVIKSIDLIEQKPEKLRVFSKKFHNFLLETNFDVSSDSDVPYKIFTLKNKYNLKEFHDFCKTKGLYFILKDDYFVLNLNLALSNDDKRLNLAYKILEDAAKLFN